MTQIVHETRAQKFSIVQESQSLFTKVRRYGHFLTGGIVVLAAVLKLLSFL